MIYHYTTLRNFMRMVHFRDGDEFDMMHKTGNIDVGNYLILNSVDVRTINFKLENKLIRSAIAKGVRNRKIINSIYGDVCSISFCKCRDYIPMWNMCVHEESDVGICLGFSTDGLEERVNAINGGSFSELILGDCKYMKELELENQVYNDIKPLCGMESDAPLNSDEMKEEIRQIMVKSAFYRLKDFEYEQETRLVGIPDREGVQEGRGLDGTSVKVKIPSRSFKEIVIGPRTRNKDIVEMGIEALLSNYSYRKMGKYGINIKVELSKLELR